VVGGNLFVNQKGAIAPSLALFMDARDNRGFQKEENMKAKKVYKLFDIQSPHLIGSEDRPAYEERLKMLRKRAYAGEFGPGKIFRVFDRNNQWKLRRLLWIVPEENERRDRFSLCHNIDEEVYETFAFSVKGTACFLETRPDYSVIYGVLTEVTMTPENTSNEEIISFLKELIRIEEIEDAPIWIKKGSRNGVFNRRTLVSEVEKGFKLLEGVDLSGANLSSYNYKNEHYNMIQLFPKNKELRVFKTLKNDTLIEVSGIFKISKSNRDTSIFSMDNVELI